MVPMNNPNDSSRPKNSVSLFKKAYGIFDMQNVEK
jgi:hypothetical protein